MNIFNKIKNHLFSKKQKNFSTINPQPVFTKDFFKSKLYSIGDFTYGQPLILDWEEESNLTIGKYCSIADDVKIFLGGNHRVDWISTFPFKEFSDFFPIASKITGHPMTKGNVIIGNDVWIGRGVTILSGVKIGDGAVLGAGSVIAKDVNPYEIVAGNPCRVLRKRFNENEIQYLLELKWWDLPIERINMVSTFLNNHDFEKLKIFLSEKS